MFNDLFGKLQEAQQKMQEKKATLSNIMVEGEAGDGAVKVTVTGNREIKAVSIDDKLLSTDHKEELEDLLITALNRAMENAEQKYNEEMQGVAGDMLGGFGQ